MFVVVVGELGRDTEEDNEQVLDLLEELKSQYSDLTIVSAASKHGIGAFVKNRCMQNKENPEFGFVEVNINVWTRMDKANLAKVFMCRNPSLVEIGEEFHIFTSGKVVGHIPDLICKVKEKGLPLIIHEKDGTRKLVNYISSNKNRKVGSPLLSNSLKDALE